MEKIAEGISDFSDFEAILFRASDGRHFVRIVPFEGLEKPHNLVAWRGPLFRMAQMFE